MAEFGFASDGTLKNLVSAAEAANGYLAAIAAAQAANVVGDIATVKRLVASGAAESIFTIGGQVTDNWTDAATSTEYSAPHDIVSFENVTLEDGEEVPAMWLQWHYATPYIIPFDAREAFYYAKDGLSAGTYSFAIGATFGKLVAGATWYFTLANDVPQGGQLVFASDLYSNTPDGTSVYVYSSSDTTEISEEATLSQSAPTSSVTDLGTMAIASTTGNLNAIQRAVYGYARWSQSALRQYLNSSSAAGAWWSAQNVWDRPPAEAATYPGFMSGYGEEFLNAIQKVKVTCAQCAGDGSGTDVTYDYFFLPSLEQMYITPQNEGIEGSYFPYWKRACGASSPVARQTTGAVPIIYRINQKTSARAYFLRSAKTDTTYQTWGTTVAGYVGFANASGVFGSSVPVCVVC